MAAVKWRVAASEARVSQARGGFYPRVDLRESYRRTNNPLWAFGTKLHQEVITASDFNPETLNDPDSIDNFATTLSLTVPIYDRGQLRGDLAQAKLSLEAAGRLEARTRQEVATDARIAYWGLQLALENLGLVEKTLATARAHHKMVESRYRNGMVVKSDLLRAQVRVAELEQMRLQTRSQMEVARAALNAAMGMDTDRAYMLTTALEGHTVGPGSLEVWVSRSMKRRPDLGQVKLQERIAEEEVKKAQSAHMPGLYLSGHYEVNSEDYSETGSSYTVGAVMRLNLFSGFQLQSRSREAMARLRETRALVRRLEIGIRMETRQAFYSARSAHERIAVAQAAVAQAEEGLRIVRNRYENGLFTIVHLLDAEVALQQARTHHLRAVHDYRVAMARLHLAVGTADDEKL
jgi:outer membrane protein TolC